MKSFIILAISVSLYACASQSNWSPTVDPYSNPNSSHLDQDLYECRQLALQASGGTLGETFKGAAVGGAIGAATGAAIGAISGSAGTGAAYGAAIGGFGGGARQGFQSEDQYKRAYTNCLRHRGHYVIN